ncbi:MAG: phosphodiester glycosidase family protein [Oscillospiraceae bacterium]|jgi:exopolysaccharide biosynthesis protein|nr:phosphodiester glycosidase family protein [Oscillospiraceae bacterium]
MAQATVITSPAETAERQAPRGQRLTLALKILGRALAVLLVLVLAAGSLAVGAARIFCLGPSVAARDLFVVSCEETSALKFVPRLFLSQEEIEAVFLRNSVAASDEVTSRGLTFEEPAAGDSAQPDIALHDISGETYKGKLMVIKDPSRVKLATIPAFGEEASGRRIEDFVADSAAVAGINAGGFEDENGVGTGGQPVGLIIQGGVLRCGSAAGSYDVVGFDSDDRLVVGRMTGGAAMSRGIRDAVSFGPVFIVNGNASEVAGWGGGLNPRTVIGQRADGAVLMLVIDGRQPSSLGATYRDCIDIMLEYGAVNAANLDGGSSSVMVYGGEIINVCASIYGSRQQPGAFIVI